MTEKKESIISTALKLFAENGYVNTSTSAIAKKAGVSEGLIFRHFGNKEGLLDAIVQTGILMMGKEIDSIATETDPRSVLQRALDFVQYCTRDLAELWKLQMSLKYQNREIARRYYESSMMHKMHNTLENAFRKLNYTNPKAEAELFSMILSSVFTVLAKEDQAERKEFIRFIRSKYSLDREMGPGKM